MKNIDVVAVCNALVDILVHAKDSDLEALSLTKGRMHLVEHEAQARLLQHFGQTTPTVELGGSAMNVVRTLAALGAKTSFAGMVGKDHFGEQIRRRMHQLRIRDHLGNSNDATGSCVILVTPEGERTMNTHLGASRLYSPDQIPHDDISHARVLHFCGYQWDTDGQKAAVQSAMATAKKHNTLISFDLADPFVVGRYKDEFWKIIEQEADIVFANREEIKLLTGLEPAAALKKMVENNVIAVIKTGAEGALVGKQREVFQIQPRPVEVVDTTAAGDMFAAGFLYGFTRGQPLQKCGDMGAYLATDVISRMGATVSAAAISEVAGM